MPADERERKTYVTLTQNQLQELLESEHVKALVEASEEQGFIESTDARDDRRRSTS